MRLIAASIVCSALIIAYAINLPFRDCVSGYLERAEKTDSSTKALAAMTCHLGRR